MRSYLRYLRIAFSITCGIAAVILCVLWVRSYWRSDFLGWKVARQDYYAISEQGWIAIGCDGDRGFSTSYLTWSSNTNLLQRHQWVFEHAGGEWSFVFPHWILSIVFLVILVLPWLPFKRFSLRTLLITMTLGCLALGLVVWLLR